MSEASIILLRLLLGFLFAVSIHSVSVGEPASDAKLLPGFRASGKFNEQELTITNDLGVRIVINAPASEAFAKNKPVKLVLYGLPNGNTIEQTIGKKIQPGDDWHFDIQHIGAQTRYLRQVLTNEALVVAYLENNLKSWPAWRKKHGDTSIPQIVTAIRKPFAKWQINTVLSGHSGGGSFIFGYLNTLDTIPADIERITFLDSNYAYDSALHRDKLLKWLSSSEKHFLTVMAYHDSVALLNGKTFVSEAGGTWGRSHLMKKDFERDLKFSENVTPEFQNYWALESRVLFLLKENPDKKIYHTVQVERNGFIHALLAGTPHSSSGYTYFGQRAYEQFIHTE